MVWEENKFTKIWALRTGIDLRRGGEEKIQEFSCSLLDMDIKDIIELRQAGKTYYQIAADKGITPEDYKNELLEKKNAYVDEQVKSGIITEDQGSLIKERIDNNIDNCNGQAPGSGRFSGGCGMGRSFSWNTQ